MSGSVPTRADNEAASHATAVGRPPPGAVVGPVVGPGPDGAALALLYFMGTYADVPHVRRSLLEPDGSSALDRGFAFEQLARATRPLDRSRLAVILSPRFLAFRITKTKTAT